MDFDMDVPGAFVEHSPPRPTAIRTNALSHSSSRSIFHLPQPPSAASSISRPARNTRPGSEIGSYSGSRKRQRLDMSYTASAESRGYFSHSNFDKLNSPMDAQSPAPLVNTDYRLAGGVDVPWTPDEHESDRDLDYRMNRFNMARSGRDYGYDPRTPEPLAREGNGRKRDLQKRPAKGWDISRTVWALTGGAALKAANFAWSTGKAFTGFQAGGGQAYSAHFADQSWTAVEEREDPFSAGFHGRRDRTGTPIPGEFPENGIHDSYIEDYMQDPAVHQKSMNTSTPISQRYDVSAQMLDSVNSGSWVVVQPQDTRDASPTRRHKPPNGSLGYISRPVTRGSLADIGPRPRLQPRTSTTNASYASPRARTYTAESMPSADTASTEAGPRSTHSSTASPRRESTVPISPDVLKYEKKLRSKDKKMDSSMRRLNAQLADMIREGKEALGAKIEVRDTHSGQYETDAVEDIDEGYAGSDSLHY